MNLDAVKKDDRSLYPVNKVPLGFQYWKRKLFQQLWGMFEYDGLPDSLPAIEIEKRTLYGFAGIFDYKKYGLITAWGTLSGVSIYNRPTLFTWSQANLGSGTLEIGKGCEVVFNDSSDETSEYQTPRGLTDLVNRYARQLADVDSSINILTVNSRQTSWTVAKNKPVAESIKSVRTMMRMGNYDVVMDPALIDQIKTIAAEAGSGIVTMSDLLNLKEHLLRDFAAQIGIKSAERKAERMLTDEIAADDDLLAANVQDMLDARQRGWERVNKHYGLNVTVRLGRVPALERDGSMTEDPVDPKPDQEVNENVENA